MPFIIGRFYMNPAYGRALERARAAEAERGAFAERRCSAVRVAPTGAIAIAAGVGSAPLAARRRRTA